MNDKFEHLMYQAGLTAQGCWDQMDRYDHEAIEKFALLIVRECVQSVKDTARAMGDIPLTTERVGSIIRTRFGVQQ